MPHIFIYISCISDKSTMLVRTRLGNGIRLSGLAHLETEKILYVLLKMLKLSTSYAGQLGKTSKGVYLLLLKGVHLLNIKGKTFSLITRRSLQQSKFWWRVNGKLPFLDVIIQEVTSKRSQNHPESINWCQKCHTFLFVFPVSVIKVLCW